MSDMTRARAISELNQIYGMLSPDKQRALDVAINSLKIDEQYDLMYEQVEPETGWIPVSERLPDKDGDYLVCYEKGYMEDYDLSDIGIAGFEVDCESFGYWYEHFDHRTLGSLGSDWERIPVIAWMPLPEPYEDGGE